MKKNKKTEWFSRILWAIGGITAMTIATVIIHHADKTGKLALGIVGIFILIVGLAALFTPIFSMFPPIDNSLAKADRQKKKLESRLKHC